MVQSYDKKERRRKALQRKFEEKRRNPVAKELGSKKYRQRIREVKEQEFDPRENLNKEIFDGID